MRCGVAAHARRGRLVTTRRSPEAIERHRLRQRERDRERRQARAAASSAPSAVRAVASKGMPTPPVPVLAAFIGPELPAGALCAGRSPWWDADVPGETDAARKARLDAAQEICSVCPVRVPCAAAGREGAAASGMWGGVLQSRNKHISGKKGDGK